MKCHFYIDGTVWGCFIPVLKTDKKLEVTGCEGCIKEIVEIVKKSKKLTLDETKRLLGLEVDNDGTET